MWRAIGVVERDFALSWGWDKEQSEEKSGEHG